MRADRQAHIVISAAERSARPSLVTPRDGARVVLLLPSDLAEQSFESEAFGEAYDAASGSRTLDDARMERLKA